MRQELVDPLKGNAIFESAVKLVSRIYELNEDGEDCSEELADLSKLTGKRLSRSEFEDAAELIEPQDYAFSLVAESIPVPTDLSDDEMLELLERIINNADDVPRLGYWEVCLERNTGDKRITTLISAPELYFDDPNRARRLSAREILDTALAAGRTK